MLFDFTKYNTPNNTDNNAPRFQPLAQPLPENTVVRVRIHTVQSEFCPADCRDGCVSEAKTGLRSLRVQAVICDGPCTGQGWYDSIVLPPEMQRISLDAKQDKACRFGGRMLAHLLAATNKPQQCNSWHVFDGLEVYVAVAVNTYGQARQVIKEVLAPNDPRTAQAMAATPAPVQPMQAQPAPMQVQPMQVQPMQVQPMQVQPMANWGQPAPAFWGQSAPMQAQPAPAQPGARTPEDDQIPF